MLAMPFPVLAQEAVLVLGNERYEQFDRVNCADDILRATGPFETLDFKVFSRALDILMLSKFLRRRFRCTQVVGSFTCRAITDFKIVARTWLISMKSTEPDLFTVHDADLDTDATLWDCAIDSDTLGASQMYVAHHSQGQLIDDAEAQIKVEHVS